MQGRIIANITNQYVVETKEGIYTCVARGRFKKEGITPMVGDVVEVASIEDGKKEGIIEKILPRSNEMKRPKISNISQLLLIVSSKLPSPDLLLLDKQLAYLEYNRIQPIIVVNKTDLDEGKAAKEIQEIYEKAGYIVLTSNAKEGTGVENIQKILQNKNSAFSGNSGVGKSTLLNSLFQKEITQEGEISSKNKKGKNTTTAVQLYKLQEETYIADTPRILHFFSRRNKSR